MKNIHGPRVKNHKCEVCAKSFFSATYLKQHMKIHNEREKYSCTQCPKEFMWWNNLREHVKNVHDQNYDQVKFPCSDCSKEFTCKTYLKRHHRTVHEKPIHMNDECRVCTKKFEFLKNSVDTVHEKPIHCVNVEEEYCS